MGIKIFRDDNWHRITNGVISRKDIMNLDGEKDRELIGYLIAHAPESCLGSMMKYATEKYGVERPPEPRLNIDDPDDTFFWEYAVLREQIDDPASVKSDLDVAAFIEMAPEALGKKGRFVVKLSGIPQENSVLAEGKSKKACNQCIEEFERMLIKKGYMECEHAWERLSEEDFGEMDYRSDGGGVAHFIVTLYRCRICDDLKKEWQGDFCGDPQEYLKITESDRMMAKR